MWLCATFSSLFNYELNIFGLLTNLRPLKNCDDFFFYFKTSRWNISKLPGKPQNDESSNRQMKRPDSKSSCYTQTKIDIYFLSFCIRHTWGGLGWAIVFKPYFCSWMPMLPVAKFQRSLHMPDSFALCSLDCILVIYSFISFSVALLWNSTESSVQRKLSALSRQ